MRGFAVFPRSKCRVISRNENAGQFRVPWSSVMMRLAVPDTPAAAAIQMAEFSTGKPGTSARSESAVTTEQLPSEKAIAAIMMSTCCMGWPMRLSPQEESPHSQIPRSRSACSSK